MKGNIFQMLLKLWIFPWFPRLEIFIYNLLGVGVFRYILMHTIGLIGKGGKRQTHYHLGERTMNNLLTFATNQTMFNESVHIVSGMPGFLLFIVSATNGFRDFRSQFNYSLLVLTLIILYCVMLQRYNRAKLVLLIEERLNAGEIPNEMYENWLALDFSFTKNPSN